jgi:hypothetical protein
MKSGVLTRRPRLARPCFRCLGVFAEFERSMIRERVRAGLARAKGEGKPAKLENAIREALNKPGRPGVRKIAERFGVDPGTAGLAARGHLAAAARLHFSDGGLTPRGPPDDPSGKVLTLARR